DQRLGQVRRRDFHVHLLGEHITDVGEWERAPRDRAGSGSLAALRRRRRSFIAALRGDDVDGDAERCRRPPMAVAQDRVPQRFQRAAELQCETRGYSRVPGVRVALASWLARLKEDLADRAISMSADRSRVALAGDFKVETFAGAAVFESLPHGRASK